MNDLKIFQNEEFGQVRVVMQDGEPWFVANDVCRALSVDRTQIRRLDADEKGVHTIHTPGGEQKTNIINESGLYSLILTSRKPEAHAFKRWVTHDILPSIARTGEYTNPEAPQMKDTITIDYNTLTTIASVFTAETVKALLPYIRGGEPVKPKAEPPKMEKREIREQVRTRRPVLLKDFCELLRDVQEKQCLDNLAVARRLNVCPETVSKWRNDRVKPTTDNYIRFVMEFNIPVNQLGEGVF